MNRSQRRNGTLVRIKYQKQTVPKKQGTVSFLFHLFCLVILLHCIYNKKEHMIKAELYNDSSLLIDAIQEELKKIDGKDTSISDVVHFALITELKRLKNV